MSVIDRIEAATDRSRTEAFVTTSLNDPFATIRLPGHETARATRTRDLTVPATSDHDPGHLHQAIFAVEMNFNRRL